MPARNGTLCQLIKWQKSQIEATTEEDMAKKNGIDGRGVASSMHSFSMSPYGGGLCPRGRGSCSVLTAVGATQIPICRHQSGEVHNLQKLTRVARKQLKWLSTFLLRCVGGFIVFQFIMISILNKVFSFNSSQLDFL